MYKRLLEIAIRYVRTYFFNNNTTPSPVLIKINNVQDMQAVRVENDAKPYLERK